MRIALLTLFLSVMIAGCATTLDRKATFSVLKNTTKITSENDVYVDEDDDLTDVQKDIKHARNEEFRQEAAEMAYSAGNSKEAVNELVPGAIKDEEEEE